MEEKTKRSRFKAEARGENYRVTSQDVQVLQLLNRYRYLPSTYIAALLDWKGDYYKDVLHKLRHKAGLVDCPAASWAAANARYRPAVYALTRAGEAYLQHHGLYAPRPKSGHEFYHELMVCLIRASFELGAREHGLELFTPEAILNHSSFPKATRFQKDPWRVHVRFQYDGASVEQDAETDGEFFGLGFDSGSGRETYIFPGFEADRHSEPLEPESYERPSIKKKFIAFREAAAQGIYRKHFGFPDSVLIPFVTINEAHMRSMMRTLDKITNGHGSALFVFKSLPNFAAFEHFPPPTGHMVSEPWQRVGHPPLNLLTELKGAASGRTA